VQIVFDTKGNDKQKEVARHWLNDEVEDIVYGGSKGSGKSYLGCSLIFGDAFLYPGTHYFIARKELNDLRKFTIPSIYEVFNHWGISEKYYNYNGQDSFFRLHNDSKVFLLDAKSLPSDPQFQRFGSMQMTRGWIEEAGEFEEAAKNGLAISIGRWKNDVYKLKGKLLQTCNPSKNYLYYNYYQKHKDSSIESFKRFVQALPQDNKCLPPGYIEMLERTLNHSEKQRLLHGDWEYDSDPAALIGYQAIINCFSNNFDTLKGNRFITVDVARFGSDKTVIGLWDGWRVKLFKYKGYSVTETAKEILRFQMQYEVPMSNVIADEDGVGGGVVDILGCRGFVNNSKPLENPVTNEEENYTNLKSQCYVRLANRINSGGLYIECDDPQMKGEIVQELEQVKQHNMDKDTKRQVLPKDKVKELIGRSPDFSDTLMMREWFEIGTQYTWVAF
jgi:phage terminase large subunit